VKSRTLLAGTTLALATLTACDSAERRDAETVVAAITRFRAADNASTPAMVDALKATPCSAPDSCKTRDDCLASGEPTAQALRLKADVEKNISAIEKGKLAKDSPEAQELPKKLDDAEKLLNKGRDALTKCDEDVQALKRKHRL
jgi:hypothetical protein